MSDARNGVLVLRPAGSAERTLARIGELGRPSVHLPVMNIVDTGNPVPEGPFDAVALTSAAAARVIAARWHGIASPLADLPTYCVGDATAAAARVASWQNVVSADGDASQLALMLARSFAGRNIRILYLCGRDRAFDLSAALSPHGFDVVEAVIYAAEPVEMACAELAEGLARCDTVLLHSARATRHFFAEAGRCGVDLSKLTLLAISETVASAIPAELRSAARVAAHPDEPALLALLERGGDSDPDMKQ